MILCQLHDDDGWALRVHHLPDHSVRYVQVLDGQDIAGQVLCEPYETIRERLVALVREYHQQQTGGTKTGPRIPLIRVRRTPAGPLSVTLWLSGQEYAPLLPNTGADQMETIQEGPDEPERLTALLTDWQREFPGARVEIERRVEMRTYQLTSGNQAYVDSLNESAVSGTGWRLQANTDGAGQIADTEARLLSPEGVILFHGRIDGTTLSQVKRQIGTDMAGLANAAPPPGKPAYQATTGDERAAEILSNYKHDDWTLTVKYREGTPAEDVQILRGDEVIGKVPTLPRNTIAGMVTQLIKRHAAKVQAAPSPPVEVARPAPVEQAASGTQPAKSAPEEAAQSARSARAVGKSMQAAPPTGDDVPEREIPLSQIGHFPGGNQRTTFDPTKMEELAASIRVHGVAQAILVNEVDGHYLLIAGERRLRASHMAGRPTIRARVLHLTESEALELMAVENLQREDLNPIDEARAYQRLLQALGSRERVADRLGKGRVHVTEYLQLLDLPANLQQQVATGTLSVRAGLDYLRRTREAPEPVRERIAQRLAEERPTAREAPGIIDKELAAAGVARATPPKREQPSTKTTAPSTPEAQPSPPVPESATIPPAPAPAPGTVAVPWRVRRRGELQEDGFLQLGIDGEGTVTVTVTGDRESAGLSVKFFRPGNHGGSPRTLAALQELMAAMKADNGQ